jgi:GTPase SAR1 family protein
MNQYIPIKIVFLGDSSVGKTSLIFKILFNDYLKNPTQTIGIIEPNERTREGK